jgi:hypothetical protein
MNDMARPNTLAGGRKPTDRSEETKFLLEKLDAQGWCFANEILREGVAKGFTPKGMKAAATELELVTTKEGPASKWMFEGTEILDEPEKPKKAASTSPEDIAPPPLPLATVTVLRHRAKGHHACQMKSKDVEAALLAYSKQNPANEFDDDGVLRIVIRTIVESCYSPEEREWERIESLPSDEITDLIKALKSKPRRLMTAEEVAAASKVHKALVSDARSNLQLRVREKKAAFANIAKVGVELSLEEIDATPDIAAFKDRHAANNQPVGEGNKTLLSMRAAVPHTRFLSDEELHDYQMKIDAEIAELESEFAQHCTDAEAAIASLSTRFVSSLTENEKARVDRLRRILDARPYVR